MKISINGVDYPVQVDDAGMFSATVSGLWYEADTLAGLRSKVLINQCARIEIPFTTLDNGVIRHGICTGVGRDGNLLVCWEDNGARTELATWHLVTLQRLDFNQSDHYRRLAAALWAADAQLRSFENVYAINLRDKIAETIMQADKREGINR